MHRNARTTRTAWMALAFVATSAASATVGATAAVQRDEERSSTQSISALSVPAECADKGFGFVQTNIVVGTPGDDVLNAKAGVRNIILGLGGNDEIHGAGLADCLDGGSGHDLLFGEGGDDVLIGGENGDTND